jgi:hypothetical protein
MSRESVKAKATMDGLSLVSLPDKDKPVDPHSPKCAGCGRYHGQVGIEVHCLKRLVAELKATIALLRGELEAVRRPVREALALPCTKGGTVEERRDPKRFGRAG